MSDRYRLVMPNAGTAAFIQDDAVKPLQQHFGAGKTWNVHGTTLDLLYLAEVYRRVESASLKGGAGEEIEMRREDRALQLLRKAGFIKYAGRKNGWKTTAAMKAADERE